MKSLSNVQQNWEGLAQSDPLWAICTDPGKRNRKWDRAEFFSTGRREVATVLKCVAGCGVVIGHNLPALDFGCGVGRLTQALAAHFPECWGVDISPTMVRLAKEFSHERPQCRFLVNGSEKLDELENNYFGFAYSSIVLQHIDTKYSRQYITELVRVLKPGGVLVFQIPDRFCAGPFTRARARLALRSRVLSLFGGKTIDMHCMKEAEVRGIVEQSGARVVDVRLTNSTDPAFCGDLKYLRQEPTSGYLSKQYTVVKSA